MYSGPLAIGKISNVDYIVYTQGRHREKHLCHVNTLKLYQKRESDEKIPSHIAVCSVVAEANHDMVGDAPKFTNLESFQIKSNLSHLTPEE